MNTANKKSSMTTQIPQPINIKKSAAQVVSGRMNLIMIDHEALPFK